jgi:glycosyltransferase involved in cell wall biosynthesis
MRCPSLAELPPPPPGRSGWPWTEEWPPDAETLPRITVITPSFRQAQFIEQTIRSVLLSGYPDLEYFVLDGGSTDGTREIIEKYSPWLAGWRCEKDAGQSAAINEGWTKATGDVLSWINSDDWYHPGALVAAGRRFAADPAVMWVSGAVDDVDVEGVFHKRHPAAATPLACALGRKDYGYFQPGMFWRRALVEKVGSLDVKLNCAFDQDFWLRSLLAGYVLTPLPEPVACFRVHGASKTGGLSPKVIAEDWAMFARYGDRLSAAERRQAEAWLTEYEASYLVDATYSLLQAGKRREALAYLLSKIRLAPRVHPHRIWWGALFRTLTTGRPPAWFGW